MTDRLTRAQRKKIESETHQKLDLDQLAEINVHELIEGEHQQDAAKEESASKEELSAEETSDSAEETSDSSEEESEDEEEDLDDLLNKAQKAIESQSADIVLETDDVTTKLSKMDTGISSHEELYLKKVNGRTKLVSDAVELVDNHNKPSKKATVVLKESKSLTQPLTKKERQAEREKTSGKAWFDMPRAEMTDEIKRDLQVLKMRHILDRKRHYKKMGKNTADPKYFQVGTIIESPTEFYSARINKKDRKETIVDELMASDDLKQYYKRKYNEVYEKSSSGGKKHYKKLKAQRQWNK